MSEYDLQRAAEDVVYLIVESGGIATKSRVEDYLMERFAVDRYQAHRVMNDIESQNVRPFVVLDGGVYWNQIDMMRAKPSPEEYPTLKLGRE